MKKILAVVLLASGAIGAMAGTPAGATDNVCVPITVDGQPVACVDKQPVDDAVSTAIRLVVGAPDSAARLANEAQLILNACTRIERTDDATTVYLAYQEARYSYNGGVQCYGFKVTVPVTTAGATQHVPQVCLTITNTCVGPYDPTVPVPAPSGSAACVQEGQWYSVREPDYFWYDGNMQPIGPGCAG